MNELKEKYYEEIKNQLLKNEVSKKIREYYTNKNDLTTYYEVGKLLSMAGKHYGDNIIKQYAIRLEQEINKKYNERTLRRMRQFNFLFSEQKWSPVATELTWTHYQELLSIKDINEIDYYINEVAKNHLSKRELREKIKNKEYQRLNDETKNKLINNEKLEIIDYIKNPIILNKKHDYNKISEFALKEIIMNDLDNFLKQLGDGFCYIENEYKLKIGDTYNYIDILLFNIIFNCYVVVELKINKIKKQDIGQIMIYINYIDKHVKRIDQDKTIGIIVCKKDDRYLIEYSSDSRIKITTYELV